MDENELSLQEELSILDLGRTVFVPKEFEGSAESKETLEDLSATSIVAGAQKAMRLLAPAGTATHAESEAIAKPVMGVASFYNLCRKKPEIDMLSPEDKLKLLGIFGGVYRDQGMPSVEISVAKALSPKVAPKPAPAKRYLTRYNEDRHTVDTFFRGLMNQTDKYDRLIADLWMDVKERRYAGAIQGCFEPTPETHPIHEEVDPQAEWDAIRPSDFVPKDGRPEIVWNCSGDRS